MSNNVSFKSNIKFVKYADFQRVKGGKYVDFHPTRDMFIKANEFYTESVRTCTAGGLIDTKNNEAVGFHFYDCEEVFQRIQKYAEEMFGLLKKPSRAFLIGSKNLTNAPYAIEQFQILKSFFTSNLDKVTVFEEHQLPWSETDIHYSVKEDTLNIHTMMRYRTDFMERDVQNRDELFDCFKNITLAKGDKIILDNTIIQ